MSNHNFRHGEESSTSQKAICADHMNEEKHGLCLRASVVLAVDGFGDLSQRRIESFSGAETDNQTLWKYLADQQHHSDPQPVYYGDAVGVSDWQGAR